MGSGLYAASKGIAMSDLITTVTPEKRVEEWKVEEQVEDKKVMWRVEERRAVGVEERRVVEVEQRRAVEVEEEDETTKVSEVSQPSPPTPVRQDTKVEDRLTHFQIQPCLGSGLIMFSLCLHLEPSSSCSSSSCSSSSCCSSSCSSYSCVD